MKVASQGMRALHVFPAFSKGSAAPPGSRTNEESFARHLSYAQNLGAALPGAGVKVESVNLAHGSLLGLLPKLWGPLRRCDVVLAGFLPPDLSGLPRLARARKKPVVSLPRMEGSGREPAASITMLAMSEHHATELSRVCPKCKVFEIGTGVDPAALKNGSISGARFREKHGLGERPFVFTPGGKGLDLALDAMYFFPPGSMLLAVASEPTGGKLPSERVQFLGALSRAETWDAYDACDVVLLPSTEEKWGEPILEAWARGKAVLANPNSPAAYELMDDAIDGFLCDNSRTISKRVEMLLEHPALARKIGEAGKKKLLAKYTWEEVAKRVRDVYESIAASCAIPQGD